MIEASTIPPILAAPIPPPEPLSFLEYVRTVQRNFIAGFHEDVYRKPIVEIKYTGLHGFIVNDPAGVRRILVDNVANYPKAKIEHRSFTDGVYR